MLKARKTRKKLTEKKYSVVVDFPNDVTYEERESIIRRALFREENTVKEQGYKKFKYIIASKDMSSATINFLVR